MMKFARPLGWTLGLILLGGIVYTNAERTAYAQANPVSGTVYVLSEGEWREAFVTGATGRISQGQPSWSYTVDYVNGGTETQVSADRVRTVQQAQTEGLTEDVYDLSTQTGIDQMLSAHNVVRQRVGVDGLNWSSDLAVGAQDWANTLIEQGIYSHSPASQRQDGYIGENLANARVFGVGTVYQSPATAIQGWIDEAQHYDYGSNRCAPGQVCGHYTQMVWADTTAVGCAVARSDNQKREVWVCHYEPGGNVVGQRPY
ncbi:MAG: CAP domain-containing protein [Cyanobacteria bacterium P01_A01_bin.15]